MKAIAFWNRKGGTGKTTTTGNTAAYLAEYGRVLMIDTDPQGNLTSWMAKDPQAELADVLNGTMALTECIQSVGQNLDILPTFAIGGDLKEYAETKLFKQPFAFADLCDSIEQAGYDYAVFDLAPGDSILERSVIGSVDEVILVANPEYFAADGLEAATSTLQEVRKAMRATFSSGKLVANRIHKNYAAHQVLLESYANNPEWSLYRVGQSTKIHDAVMMKGTVKEWDPGNKHAPEYKRLAEGVK